MSELITSLKPGQSADFANGYVARQYWGGQSYWAEALDRNGESVALSENFPTFSAAFLWLQGHKA